ncbi:MAG: Fic family protein [Tatlockia sp.]|nr:Fic family protein [Tatlockia sp.]
MDFIGLAKFRISKQQTLKFIDLIKRLIANPAIKIKDSQKKYLKNNNYFIGKEKLAVAYLNNKLTIEERNLVQKIAIICMDPEEIPQAMIEFAENTLADWKACNKKDKKAVSEFLAEMFYQLTEVYPYGNANGRTATCVKNLFLRTIELPSILLRNPGDRDLENSPYSVAINLINQTRKPLAEHIYQRITVAENEPFSNLKLEESVALRCGFVKKIQQLQLKFPQYDIDEIQEKLQQVGFIGLNEGLNNKDDLSIFIFKNMKSILNELEENLQRSSIKSEKLHFFGATSLKKESVEEIKAGLIKITHTEGWRINPKNHLEGWVEINDLAKAKEIAEELNRAKIGTVVQSKRKDNGIPVVKCSNINVNTLEIAIKSIELNSNDEIIPSATSENKF